MNPFFSADNVIALRRRILQTGVPKVDAKTLSYYMIEVSRELKIHYEDEVIETLNDETVKRMVATLHPDAKYMDDVGRLPDKAPMDATFRNDSMGQPPQFEEKSVTLPPHLAVQIGFPHVQR